MTSWYLLIMHMHGQLLTVQRSTADSSPIWSKSEQLRAEDSMPLLIAGRTSLRLVARLGLSNFQLLQALFEHGGLEAA